LHGGSFITGGLHSELERCAYYAESARCAVVSVDYRLAPEHPFPAALTDCLSVLEWLGRQGEEHGLDRERVAIGGLSAGGALAAATTLCLRDTRIGVAAAAPGLPAPGPGAMSVHLVLQMLLYPVLDASITTASSHQFTDTPVLQAHQLPTLWKAYLPDPAEPSTSWASPALTSGFAGCPPAFIAVAQLDPLRDEALRFAERMIAADIPVDVRLYARTYHSFDAFHTTRIGRIARHHQAESLAAAFR
jgi:acetyl esterase